MSLMNGLAALGTGVSQFAGAAGLEQQKSDLADQTARLADQLATTRETTLQQSAGDIAAQAAAKQQAFQSGESALQRTSAEKIASGQQAATIQAATIGANVLPDPVKTFNWLQGLTPGAVPPPANGTTAGSPPGVAPNSSAAPNSTGGGSTGVTPGVTTGAPTAAPGVSSPAANPGAPGGDMLAKIVNSMTKFGAPGSEVQLNADIAKGVAADPKFANAPDDQKAIETLQRIQLAKLGDPGVREAVATGIATYQLQLPARLEGTQEGQLITARAMALNPAFQAQRYDEIHKAMSDFGTGTQGDIVRSDNVAIQHLAAYDLAAAALNNTSIHAVNAAKNAFMTQFGSAPPTTLDGMKQVVGSEVLKAIGAGVGSDADRDRMMTALKSANSPDQINSVSDSLRVLLAGQVKGLQRQYEDATGFKSGPFAFQSKLEPETIAAMMKAGPSAPSPVTPTSTSNPAAGPRATPALTPAQMMTPLSQRTRPPLGSFVTGQPTP